MRKLDARACPVSTPLVTLLLWGNTGLESLMQAA